MTSYVWIWAAIIGAGLLAWATKYAGHVIPERFLEDPRVHRIAAYVTVALLFALFAVQAFTSDGAVVLDARVAAVAVAALLLWRKAPFIVAVLVAAVVAAGFRALGWG